MLSSPTLRLGLFALLVLLAPVFGDLPIPANVLDPRSPAEAWNVIHLSTANVDRLLGERRFQEVPAQIALCSPALRALARSTGTVETKGAADRALGWVVAIASASLEKNEPRAAESMAKLRILLGQLEPLFDPKSVKGAIFLCPMHPDILAEDERTPCSRCGMALMPRRIPYSFIYLKPGKPSLAISASVRCPIEAGRKTAVKVQLKNGDGSPVQPADLMVLHTQPIHLLIEDPSLGDYHHEHPVPTGTPGEYTFTFTPKKSAPYRVWADVVPLMTGVQELPFVDLPCAEKGGVVADTGNRFKSSAGGLTFTLTFAGGVTNLPRAQTACGMEITITGADGRPMKQLEPLMNAFAHLVGFYDDFQTVVHLHPGGGDILDAEARGGPTLPFTFFPPRAGFIRLYCQVQVNGESVFAPFNVNVEP